MEELEINRLIKEKLATGVQDLSSRNFIEDILRIERDYQAKRGKIREYERILARYVRME